MHELSVCQSIIEQVSRIANDNNATAVTRIIVEVGSLSGVEIPLLANAFPIASAGTVAEKAELETRACPIRIKCNICHNENDGSMSNLLCKACGSWQTSLISGDEMILKSIELETAESETQAEQEV
jgi:hydrogenase nickel incorporation protein HypA/HybF